jgi:uncharacterized protein (TIGR02302 family)
VLNERVFVTKPDQSTLANLMRRPVQRTLWGLGLERLVRAFWPVWSATLLLLAALSLGVQDFLPPAAATWVAYSAILLWAGALAFGVRRMVWPRQADAIARLDRSLPGRPLTALADTQIIGADDAASNNVWRAHVIRMATRVSSARAVPPDLKLARYDPFALRYVALTGLVVASMFGTLGRVGDLGNLAQLPGSAGAVVLGPSWEAWVQPPAHTGRPSLYLNDIDRPALELPQGSRVTARFYGDPGALRVIETLSDRADLATADDPTASAQEFDIQHSGTLNIEGPNGRSWDITVLVDKVPTIFPVGAMARESGGVMRQDFTAEDDFAIVAGSAQISLDLAALERSYGLALPPEPRTEITLQLPLPISGSRNTFTESLIDDFSLHPWANLPVTIVLSAADTIGQTGQSTPEHTILPGRRFFDPMAAAVIELRRDLLWNLQNASRVVELMRAISFRPEEAFRDLEINARFIDIQDALEASVSDGLTPDTRDAITQNLWDLALFMEEGELADAAARLRRAQERLDEAVRNGADPSEIQDLMDELRDATREYMQMLAEQPRERGEAPEGGEQMSVTQDQIQELMDQIQQLMEEGRMDEAAELLARLNELLENLQINEGPGGEGGPQIPGSEALQDLDDSLRDQQDLADDTFRQLQDEFNNTPGQQQDNPIDSEALADRQRALSEQLREQQLSPLPGDGTEQAEQALRSLEEAQRAMEQAEQALRDGDAGEALSQQSEALEAMRDGLRSMNEALTQDLAENSEQNADDAQSGGRDPLGRDNSSRGELAGNENALQPNDVYRRARDLLDEIRRRSAEQERPEAELDYLRRLLDLF